MSVFKNTALSERLKLQFRAEFFNLLNRANLGTPNATVFSGTSVSASAGLITTLATTRGRSIRIETDFLTTRAERYYRWPGAWVRESP